MCKKNNEGKQSSDLIISKEEKNVQVNESQNERLLRKIKETYNSRFSAHGRLKNKSKMQRITSYVVAFWVTAASTLLLAPSLIPENYKTNLTFVVLALSIFSLAISIYFGEQNTSVEAENFHRCARELNSLYEDLNSNKDKFDYKESESTYESILNSYNLNHDTIDFKYTNEDRDYRKNQVDGKLNNILKTIKHLLFSFWYWVRNNIFYWIIIILPIVFSFILVMNVTAGPSN